MMSEPSCFPLYCCIQKENNHRVYALKHTKFELVRCEQRHLWANLRIVKIVNFESVKFYFASSWF